MGCGCGGRSNAKKQSRAVTAPSVKRNINIPQKENKSSNPHVENLLNGKKVIESTRREKLIRALKVP